MGSLKIESPGHCAAGILYDRQTAGNMESDVGAIWHAGKRRQASKGSSGTLQTLPDSCCARALSYLELREIGLVGECSLMSQLRTHAPELWLILCEERWPAVASSEALRKAVMRRHPRDYYIHTYLEHHLSRPLLDLDNHLVHLELRQKGRSICSVAREARDVFRSEVAAYYAWGHRGGVSAYYKPDGLLFDNISAKVDCSDDDMFPPEAAPVTVTYYVIRKSDGHMAVLASDDTFGQAAGGAPINEGMVTSFPQYPKLRGMLPMNCNCLSRLQHRNLSPSEGHSRSSLGWRDAEKRDNYFEISTSLYVGTDADGTDNERRPIFEELARRIPRYAALERAQSEITGPPRAVVTPGQVEIRELFMQFDGGLYTDEPNTTREEEEYEISSEELRLKDIRSILAQHLRFG